MNSTSCVPINFAKLISTAESAIAPRSLSDGSPLEVRCDFRGVRAGAAAQRLGKPPLDMDAVLRQRVDELRDLARLVVGADPARVVEQELAARVAHDLDRRRRLLATVTIERVRQHPRCTRAVRELHERAGPAQ